MSGVDEQNPDIPMCPICKKIPRFWILYPTMTAEAQGGWYWLFSDDYSTRYGNSKLEYNKGSYGRNTTLDGIVCIVCSDDNNHRFVAEHLVFQKIIRRSRGVEHVRNR